VRHWNRHCSDSRLAITGESLYTVCLQSVAVYSLKGATSLRDRGLYEYDQIRVSLCLLCLVVEVYLVVMSCFFGFFCVVWFCLLVR